MWSVPKICCLLEAYIFSFCPTFSYQLCTTWISKRFFNFNFFSFKYTMRIFFKCSLSSSFYWMQTRMFRNSFILFYFYSIPLHPSLFVLLPSHFYFSCTFILISQGFLFVGVFLFYSLILNKLLLYLKFVCMCVWQNEAELNELVRVVWNGGCGLSKEG